MSLNKIQTGIVVVASVFGVAGLAYLLVKKFSIPAPPPVATTTPSGNTTIPGFSAGGNPSPTGGFSTNITNAVTTSGGAVGKSAYSIAGLVVRSGPEVNNGVIFGIGDNSVITVASTGSLVGTVINVTPDDTGAVNPATSKIYNWYGLTLSPQWMAGIDTGSFYVREDQVTLQ